MQKVSGGPCRPVAATAQRRFVRIYRALQMASLITPELQSDHSDCGLMAAVCHVEVRCGALTADWQRSGVVADEP